MNNVIWLDIMVEGHHRGQLKYTKRGFPKVVDGKVTETYDYNDLVDFVLEKRPSLKDKDFIVLPSEQRV